MQTGDFLEITVEWTLGNASNPCLNVWHYEIGVLSEPVGLFQIGQEIQEAHLARYYGPYLSVISTNALITGFRIRNLNNPTEGYDNFGLLGSGTNTSGMLPPMVTLSIRELRENFSMRNGRKGIGGVAIPVCDATGKVSASTINLFETVFEGWSETEFVVEAEGVNLTLLDVVIRKPTTPNTPPTLFYYVLRYALSPKFGTQNSRK